MGITTEEKIAILQNKIDNLNIHINVLQEDLEANPQNDVDGKPTRVSILNDFLSKKNILEQELEALTNQA
jgi:ribosomal protein S15P/S13E